MFFSSSDPRLFDGMSDVIVIFLSTDQVLRGFSVLRLVNVPVKTVSFWGFGFFFQVFGEEDLERTPPKKKHSKL